MKKLLFVLGMLIIGLTSDVLKAQTGWSLQTNPIPPSNTDLLGKVQFVSSTEGWISATNGHLLHTTDAGATWNIVTPFPNDTVSSSADVSAYSMWWVNKIHGWKINWFGNSLSNVHGAVIHKTTDGGVSWTKKIFSTTTGDAGFQIQFVDELNGRVLIYNFLTGNAQFLQTTDGGNNWSPFIGAGIFYFVDVDNGWSFAGSGPQGANTPYIIYHTTNGGTNWTEQFSDSIIGSYHVMQFTDLNNGWIVGDSSKILKTTNGGVNWLRVTNTGINPNSNSKCVFFLNGSTGWIGANDGIINSNPNRVILHTTNGGASWIKQYPPISDGIYSIFFWDGNNGWFTGEQCVQNCNGPDSLRISQGVIGHTINGGVTGVEEGNNSIPSGYSLSQNYPNPWNPTTTINYSLAKEGNVKLSVYNTLGSKVAIIVNEYKPAGNYSIQFNGSNLASGIYLYRLESGNYSTAKKFILMK